MVTEKELEAMEAALARLWRSVGKNNPRIDLAIVYLEAAIAAVKLLIRTSNG